MRSRSGFLALGAAVALLAACSSDPVSAPTGALHVEVRDSFGNLASDAVVDTIPATESLVTDALGTVLFRTIVAGVYEVTARHPTLGAARLPVKVEAGDIALLPLRLSGAVAMDPQAPTVVILSPTSGSQVAAGAKVSFRASVRDDRDAPPLLRLEWRSSRDGKLGSSTAGNDGSVTFAAALTAGAHVVSLVATDSGGRMGQGAITVRVEGQEPGVDAGPGLDGGPGTPISLAPPTKDERGIDLSWTTDGVFASYNVQRDDGNGTFAVIGVLGGNQTTHRDETVTFGRTYRYRVVGNPASGPAVTSNVQQIEAGVFIALNTQVETMLVDPKLPLLYAIDKVNNSLHFVDLSKKAIAKTIFVGSTPVDMDFNLAQTELYVANFGSTEIAVVDLAKQAKSRGLFVDTKLGWDGNPWSLSCLASDKLVFTSEDQWNDLKLVSTLDGKNLQVIGSYSEPDLARSPDGTRVYVGESSISRATLARYDLQNGMLKLTDDSGDVGGFTSRRVVVSGDGQYVFYAAKKFQANNLKAVLGTFAEVVHAVTTKGDVAFGSTRIFDGTTFAAKGMLPVSTTVMALSPDDKTLYLYDGKSSRLYIYPL